MRTFLMATYEQDSEAYRWEVGPFHNYLFPNPPYFIGTTEQDSIFYSSRCIREVDDADASGTARDFTEDLFGPYTREYSFGVENGQEEVSNFCSSPGENSCEGLYSLDVTDEHSAADGEVGRRLNQMVPIPHVPRINGQIPSVDEAMSDHQRLTDRLQLYDLIEHKVQGDGNCQFRALSDQLYQTPEHHEFVRQQVVDQLRSHSEIYEGYVPMPYGDYLNKLSKSSEWGDHVTLQAAADSYGVKIFVITSFKDTCYIEILPSVQKSNRVIFLSFWAEVHYNSIYPEGDLPAADTKKKKKWWQFGN